LSQKMKMPVILRLTTHVCHAKEKVSFDSYTPRRIDETSRFDPAKGPYIPLTSGVFPLKTRALEKLQALSQYADTDGLAETFGEGSDRGILTAGLPSLSIRDSLEGVPNPPDLLVLGMVHPLPRETILRFLKSHKEVKVIEELDPILEKEVKVLAYEERIETRIRGKESPDQWLGEYTPDKTARVLAETWPEIFPLPTAEISSAAVPPRPAQLCPGCGHRSAFYAVKKALKAEDITVADIGCHSLGFLPPYEMGQVLLCMGHSSGTGAGLSLFNRSRKVVAFLGDSTFFHAGIPGIVNAVYNNHNLTLIIMENGTTAMTGHQDHPGSGKSVHGVAEAVSIKTLLPALGVKSIRDVDTYQQAKLTEAVKEAIEEPGFSVVIARHPCMLKFTRERRKKGIHPETRAKINQETCEKIHECVSLFGCPSFQLQPDGSVVVSEDLCIGDGSCLQTCPVQAISLEKGEKK
ncbi:MAG: indolepyruvate ferredoxin oxidoreductase subunit alpha, partial [Spirochaetales bacterium]|nr:indolepyruvate ferredoxin oxidoreductase subunit alpha [Spirochaetales bacterium]